MKERRKGRRFRIPFQVDVIPSENREEYITGEIRDFSPDGFSFEAKNIDLGINDTIRARFKIDSEPDCVHVMGRIVWKIQFGSDCQIGLEIHELDIRSGETLGFPFNMWKDKAGNE